MAPSAVTPERTASPSQSAFSNGSSVSGQKVAETPLSVDDLAACADLPIFDAQKQEHKFSELYDKPGRTLIIFVRHAFCGMCQGFLRELDKIIKPEDLKSLDTPTSLAVIFCGEPELIEDYMTWTKLRFPIYTDPGERKLYEALNMPCTLASGSRPAYQQGNIAMNAVKSFAHIITYGPGMMKGGSFSQVGGEFLFEDGKSVWLHRMQNTRDHTDPRELKRMLGLGE